MQLKKKTTGKPEIPSSSMSDIAFLLLIFFMTTTVFNVDRGPNLTLPAAEKVEKTKRKDTMSVYVDANGNVNIDGRYIALEILPEIMAEEVAANPNITVVFKADKNAEYGRLMEVFQQLQEAQAYKISLSTELESGGL
jgi:biopolymer transport protein ExbD